MDQLHEQQPAISSRPFDSHPTKCQCMPPAAAKSQGSRPIRGGSLDQHTCSKKIPNHTALVPLPFAGHLAKCKCMQPTAQQSQRARACMHPKEHPKSPVCTLVKPNWQTMRQGCMQTLSLSLASWHASRWQTALCCPCHDAPPSSKQR